MYSRRQNKVSVPFALHGERSENGDITVEKTVSKTVVKRYLNGAKTVTRKTEAVKILRDRTCCPRGSRTIARGPSRRTEAYEISRDEFLISRLFL